ncbi:hypothetical protein DMUE_2141 [Dictyocoela muelleri]|nr:hypothetical protein DMUE_2141 [Dictyocoela muelleri]
MNRQFYEEKLKILKNSIYQEGQEFDKITIMNILYKEIKNQLNIRKVTIEKVFLIELLNPKNYCKNKNIDNKDINNKNIDNKDINNNNKDNNDINNKDINNNNNNKDINNNNNKDINDNDINNKDNNNKDNFDIKKSIIEKYLNLYEIAVNNKILEFQALILDLIKTDYNNNLKVLKVEKWMKNLVNELKIFSINILFFKKIIKRLLHEIQDIFMNEKDFGGEGNLLVADLIYLKIFVLKVLKNNDNIDDNSSIFNIDNSSIFNIDNSSIFNIDNSSIETEFKEFINKFYNKISEDKRMDIEKIERLVENY